MRHTRRGNKAKAEVAPLWAECSKEAYCSGLDALARALKGVLGSRAGERMGKPVGFPRFKKKNARRSYRVTTASFGIVDRHHVRLPHIGVLRTKEPTVKLARKLSDSTARVLSATVCERAGRWYVSFCCEVERARRIARLQRRCSRRKGPGKGRPPSKRWSRATRSLAKVHAKVAHARSDGLHKLTTRLAVTYGTVVVEDLAVTAVTAMTARPKPKPDGAGGHGRNGARRKAGLNRALLDVASGELRRRLDYKCRWYGSKLVVAGRRYPSSKTLLGLQNSESQAAVVRAHLYLRALWTRDRPRPQCRTEPRLAGRGERYRQWGGKPAQATARRTRGGEERFMDMSKCSSVNCEDGSDPQAPGKTATVSSKDEAALSVCN